MDTDQFKKQAQIFINDLPYYKFPYNKKSWGNNWHSLCSYHGKLKPAIAYFLIKLFTEENDVVLDPMSGVGTIPFEACLQGRFGHANDLSKLAYIVSKSKLNICNRSSLDNVLFELENYISKHIKDASTDKLVQKYEDFGLNKSIKDYFEEQTLKEIILARKYFNDKKALSNEDCIIFSCLLHILHGNRPYALSRTSHSLTPYAPKGDFIYKSVIKNINNKLNLLFKDTDSLQLSMFLKDEQSFKNYKSGEACFDDVLNISRSFSDVDIIITSPPFVSSLKFYTQNWMRLWLSGWEEEDFKKADSIFLESKQKKDLSIYTKIFEQFYKVLKNHGKVILHLGKTDKFDMANEILPYTKPYFKNVYLGEEDVQAVQKHGIKDKGSTIVHQFLFLEKQ